MSGSSNSGSNAQNSAIQTANTIAQGNLDLQKQYQQLATGQLQQANTLNQPLEQRNAAITSGSMPAIISAMGPQLGQIEQQTRQATANDFNTIPQGAGRDFALAQAQTQKGQQIASSVGGAYQSALQSQAALGSQALGAGLQQEGAALSAGQGATSAAGLQSQTGANMQQEAAQNKASSMNLIGSLVGAGGNVAAMSIFKSDVRLKENIVPLGDVGGVPMYSYNFKGSDYPMVGPMAQEVYQKYPEAVLVGDENKPWMVNYNILAKRLLQDVYGGA